MECAFAVDEVAHCDDVRVNEPLESDGTLCHSRGVHDVGIDEDGLREPRCP